MIELLKELKERVSLLEERLNNLVKVGRVVSVNPKKATARVEFEDRDKTVSWEIPVLYIHTHRDKTYWMPRIGELVYVVSPSLGEGFGVIIGSSYNSEDTPPATDPNVVKILFEDGTTVKYDKRNHDLTINVNGGNINISVNSGTGSVNINGYLNVSKDIKAGGDIYDHSGEHGSVATLRNTYNSHTHTGDSGGSTSAPNQTV